jgi:hypothetical protein
MPCAVTRSSWRVPWASGEGRVREAEPTSPMLELLCLAQKSLKLIIFSRLLDGTTDYTLGLYGFYPSLPKRP